VKLQQWKVVESSWNDDTGCYVEVGMWYCNDMRSHLKARSSCMRYCYATILQVEKGGKELGTSAVDDVNQQSCLLYCAICIFVASWDKREGVFTSVFVALVLRSKGGWE